MVIICQVNTRQTEVLTEISGERSRLLLPGEFQKSGGQEDRDQVLDANLENGLLSWNRVSATLSDARVISLI
jgi:hypothetical protein